MPERLPIYADFPAHSYTIALDGTQYGVRLVYRARTASWYLDLFDELGTPIALGRRLSPGSSPTSGILGGPPGKLVAFGPDPYEKTDVELWYFTAAELASFVEEPEDLFPVEIFS
jgi:hypothetical protein